MKESKKVSGFEVHAYKRLLPDTVSMSDTLLAWLVIHRGIRLGGRAVVLGSNPFTAQYMVDFTSKLGLKNGPPSEDSEHLIVGRDEWRYEDLRELLEMRIGSTLRVYSQEMLLAYVISGVDPLDQAELVEELGGPHPALRFLKRVFAFDWPTTNIHTGDVPKWLEVDFFLEEGYLKYEGYTVGKGGRPRRERRSILDYCYMEGAVPLAFPEEYIAEWGEPATSTRLEKIAGSIASFCRNAKRKRARPHEAISCWEEDLEYLRTKHYEQQHFFDWPNTTVW